MTRREEIECIIIGTLLDSTAEHNYYEECRYCITADMFTDQTNGRIYGLIAKMNADGKVQTDPISILEHFGDSVMDILYRMMDLVTDWSLTYKRFFYNESQWLNEVFGDGRKAKYTDVGLAEYLSSFTKMVFSNVGQERSKDTE